MSNANGGAPGISSLTSYILDEAGGLGVVSDQVATTQTAACWVALSSNERFAFTTNAGSGSISSYSLDSDGSLSLLQAVAASPGAGPVDMAVQGDDLFTLAGGAHQVTLHRIGDGSLTSAAQVGVPVGVQGLAVAWSSPLAYCRGLTGLALLSDLGTGCGLGSWAPTGRPGRCLERGWYARGGPVALPSQFASVYALVCYFRSASGNRTAATKLGALPVF